jgi:hypothetical protein
MKKLLILTAILMLTSSAAGCRCCQWLWRGAPWNACPTAPAYSEPCPPYQPCDPCLTAPGTITPGPAPYTEAPM